MYYKMPDGSIKQINPFTGTEVWYVPDRETRPIYNNKPEKYKRILRNEKEDYCDFCSANYLRTPPEKSRLIINKGKWQRENFLHCSQMDKTTAEFRRIGNLFEIVSYQYWVKNYNFQMSPQRKEWRDAYLSERDGLDQILNMIDLRFIVSGKEARLKELNREQKIKLADYFFGGSHELIIGRRHFIDNAEFDYELCSAGELSEEEHFQYTNFVIQALKDIKENNKYVRYISVFQNWLAPAGASFDHLHKQLVALDEWGVSIEREIGLIRQDENIYNEFGPNFAIQHNLLIAENDYAVAFSDIGHRFPTIAIFSKSRNIKPFEHNTNEIRGISQIIRACHVAMTSRITCNEEWYYTPFDAVYNMPWHILIKWRTNNPAGFEGNTKIYINPISPEDLRKTMVDRLLTARVEGKILKNIKIGDECSVEYNKLKYNLR